MILSVTQLYKIMTEEKEKTLNNLDICTPRNWSNIFNLEGNIILMLMKHPWQIIKVHAGAHTHSIHAQCKILSANLSNFSLNSRCTSNRHMWSCNRWTINNVWMMCYFTGNIREIIWRKKMRTKISATNTDKRSIYKHVFVNVMMKIVDI